MVKSIYGTYKISYHPEGENSSEVVEIDFTPPFKKIRMFPTLEETLGVKLPTPDQLSTPEAVVTLKNICEKFNVECPPPQTASRLLDKVRYFVSYVAFSSDLISAQ